MGASCNPAAALPEASPPGVRLVGALRAGALDCCCRNGSAGGTLSWKSTCEREHNGAANGWKIGAGEPLGESARGTPRGAPSLPCGAAAAWGLSHTGNSSSGSCTETKWRSRRRPRSCAPRDGGTGGTPLRWRGK